jgi:hypothetical protein
MPADASGGAAVAAPGGAKFVLGAVAVGAAGTLTGNGDCMPETPPNEGGGVAVVVAPCK